MCLSFLSKPRIAPIEPNNDISPWKSMNALHPSYDSFFTEETINVLEARHSTDLRQSHMSVPSSDNELVVVDKSIKKIVHFTEFVSDTYIKPKS